MVVSCGARAAIKKLKQKPFLLFKKSSILFSSSLNAVIIITSVSGWGKKVTNIIKNWYSCIITVVYVLSPITHKTGKRITIVMVSDQVPQSVVGTLTFQRNGSNRQIMSFLIPYCVPEYLSLNFRLFFSRQARHAHNSLLLTISLHRHILIIGSTTHRTLVNMLEARATHR